MRYYLAMDPFPFSNFPTHKISSLRGGMARFLKQTSKLCCIFNRWHYDRFVRQGDQFFLKPSIVAFEQGDQASINNLKTIRARKMFY